MIKSLPIFQTRSFLEMETVSLTRWRTNTFLFETGGWLGANALHCSSAVNIASGIAFRDGVSRKPVVASLFSLDYHASVGLLLSFVRKDNRKNHGQPESFL